MPSEAYDRQRSRNSKRPLAPQDVDSTRRNGLHPSQDLRLAKRRRMSADAAERKSTPKSHQSGTPVAEPIIEQETAEMEDEQSEKGNDDLSKTTPFSPQALSKHVRFGSEEPKSQIVASNSIRDVEEMDGMPADDSTPEDSSDEAPEAIEAQTAQQNAAKNSAEAAKALRSQSQAKKRKLQEVNTRLEEQAKRKALQAERAKRKMEKRTRKLEERTKTLPDLLPEEVLNDETLGREPTPELTVRGNVKQLIAPQKRRLDLQTVLPKDRRVGPVQVRVLEKAARVLPPKANMGSKSTRDDWMAGRRGRAGLSTTERKRIGNSFLKA